MPEKEEMLMLKFPKDLYSDVRVEDVAETTLVLEDGELKQCTESRRRGAFVLSLIHI